MTPKPTVRDRPLACLRSYIKSIDEATGGLQGRLPLPRRHADPTLIAVPVVALTVSPAAAGGGAAAHEAERLRERDVTNVRGGTCESSRRVVERRSPPRACVAAGFDLPHGSEIRP